MHTKQNAEVVKYHARHLLKKDFANSWGFGSGLWVCKFRAWGLLLPTCRVSWGTKG